MKKFLLAGAALLALATTSHAADMGVKPLLFKAPVVTCTQMSCSGWFVSADLTGVGSNADIIGQGLSNSVFAGGGMIGGSFGYQFWNGTYFGAVEAGCSYDASSTFTLAGNKRYFCNQTIKLGGALSGLIPTSAPTPSQGPASISIPSALENALIAPYVLVGAAERPWGTGWDTGAGAQFIIASGWNLKLEYHYIKYGTGSTAPISTGLVTTASTENLVRLGLQKMF